MLFDVYRLFNQTPAKVDAILGRSREAKDAYGLHFRTYERKGIRTEVQFKNGRSIYFNVRLPQPAPSPVAALSLIGVDMRKRKPHSSSQFRVEWRGAFPNPAVKKVSAVNIGDGWNQMGVSNTF